MNRSQLFLAAGATAGAIALLPQRGRAAGVPLPPLKPPSDNSVAVAFLLSDGAVTIDFAGPWEVFCDAHVTSRTQPAFHLYTVAESTKPIVASGGLTIVPQYALDNTPPPNVVVVPGQADATGAVKVWLQNVAKTADLVMSVCTGAVVLAQAGLLDGRSATSHHSAFTTLGMNYPNVIVKRGVRFVDDAKISTSAGLSAGIDLALHVIARYYGEASAVQTAYDMEYQGTGWRDGRNEVYSKPQVAHAGFAVCPVCWMEVDPQTSPTATYDGKRYYFCMPAHEQTFASAPARFLNA